MCEIAKVLEQHESGGFQIRFKYIDPKGKKRIFSRRYSVSKGGADELYLQLKAEAKAGNLKDYLNLQYSNSANEEQEPVVIG